MIAQEAAGWCIVSLAANFLAIFLSARKSRARPRSLPGPSPAPPVSLVRPLCGLETFSEETLRASFKLDYRDYELLFCVHAPNDPIIPLVPRLIAEHPTISADYW